MGDDDCMICALPLSDAYCEKLSCSHIFHYECLLKTFVFGQRQTYKHTNRCPYCRDKSAYLPVINGLTRLIPSIHYCAGDIPPGCPQIRCQHILSRGKNKGNLCDKKCQIGYGRCKTHKSKIPKI